MDIFEKARLGETIDMTSPEFQELADPELTRSRILCHKINMAKPYDPMVPELLNELFLGKLPASSYIVAPLYIDRGATVTIGENVFINWNFSAVSMGSITLEDDVKISCNVSMLSVSHAPGNDLLMNCKPILVKKGAYIYAGAIILGGVTIGEGAVVAAGSVVTHDVPPFTMVAGNPARVIKKLVEGVNHSLS